MGEAPDHFCCLFHLFERMCGKYGSFVVSVMGTLCVEKGLWNETHTGSQHMLIVESFQHI